MKYEIYQDAYNYYRWRFKAANGEIIASGEGYTTKQNCLNAINLLRGSATAPVYEA